MAKKSTTRTTKKKTAPPRKRTPVTKPAAKAAARPEPALAKKSPPRKGYGQRDLDHFRRIIQDKRKEILEELESLKASMMDLETGEYANESSTYSLHMEQGTDAMEREKVFLFASREGKFLNYLDDALKRIESGNYGFCTECGKLIEKERLEAVPHTQQCVQCKLKKGSGQRV